MTTKDRTTPPKKLFVPCLVDDAGVVVAVFDIADIPRDARFVWRPFDETLGELAPERVRAVELPANVIPLFGSRRR